MHYMTEIPVGKVKVACKWDIENKRERERERERERQRERERERELQDNLTLKSCHPFLKVCNFVRLQRIMNKVSRNSTMNHAWKTLWTGILSKWTVSLSQKEFSFSNQRITYIVMSYNYARYKYCYSSEMAHSNLVSCKIKLSNLI
jgi:hypothetical protein